MSGVLDTLLMAGVSGFEEVAVEVWGGSGLVAPDTPTADGAKGPLPTIRPPPADGGGEPPPPPELLLQTVAEGVMTGGQGN